MRVILKGFLMIKTIKLIQYKRLQACMKHAQYTRQYIP